MLKSLKEKWPLLALLGVSALSIGGVTALIRDTSDSIGPTVPGVSEVEAEAALSSEVLALAQRPTSDRAGELATFAEGAPGLERDRARYMLATDLINLGNGASALPLLDGLEKTYDLLPGYVLLRRGQALQADNQPDAAVETWRQLVQSYPQSSAVPEALYQLGRLSPEASASESDIPTEWVRLLSDYPAHPLSTDIAFARLGRLNSAAEGAEDGQVALGALKLIAAHGHHHPQYVSALDRLVAEHGSSLTPQEWEQVGFGYWETQTYDRAGEAYSRAPATPQNLYRAGRGQERAGKTDVAERTYRLLAQTFPEAPETADGLLNLASNLQTDQAALATLDQVVAAFPEQAGEALAIKAAKLERLDSSESAQQAKASILSQYSASEAAAEIRLKQATENAKAGNISAAMSWAQQLVDAAPDDPLAAEAGFWLGKWAYRQNQPDLGRQAFEQVLRRHPESYYAWRAAIHLDWEVGNFDTVRMFRPDVQLPPTRLPLPAGSDELQELYLLGHNQSAWNRWQMDFANPQQPTVAEQFTDGLMRLGIGDNLDGIFMVSSLAWRDRPEEVAEYEAMKQTPRYWQAIYPFPYPDLILGWADERNLNPLLVTALVRQESRFQPNIRSVVGAVGLMQVMPETGAWISEQIDAPDYSLDTPADNVEFGTWYLDFTHRQFDNNSLFAVASYNAGPGAVSGWIDEKDYANADEFVQQIPYPETKGYVEKVFGGYWNYLRTYDPAIASQIEDL